MALTFTGLRDGAAPLRDDRDGPALTSSLGDADDDGSVFSLARLDGEPVPQPPSRALLRSD
eukprot:2587110-Prymnesium_polylepis.1